MKTELVKVDSETEVKVQEDTQFVLDFEEFGKDVAYSLAVIFEKPDAKAEIIGLYKLSDSQTLSLATSAIHKVPHTKCFTYVKGVLYDKARSDYVGKIIIESKAQQTSSYLEDNVIVVGKSTQNNSQPILEIEADDVKASHGATTGQINPEQVYYLQSRGFSEEEAKDTIIEGFFNSLLSRIKDEKIRDKVAKGLNV